MIRDFGSTVFNKMFIIILMFIHRSRVNNEELYGLSISPR